MASTLATATRVLNTERIAMRRAKELMDVKIKLDRETQLRESAEEAIAASKSRLILIDEALPMNRAICHLLYFFIKHRMPIERLTDCSCNLPVNIFGT